MLCSADRPYQEERIPNMSEVLTEERTESRVDERFDERRDYYSELRESPVGASVADANAPECAIDEELDGEIQDDADFEGERCTQGEPEHDPDEGACCETRPRASEITTKELGKRGEDAATNYLIRKGYKILERNWTCRFGEADIIAVDVDGTIVFAEVKTRRSDDCGLPEEAITKEKRRRYEKIGLCYLMEADWNDDVDFRFDAIGIYVTGDFQAVLKHHIGCFDGLL